MKTRTLLLTIALGGLVLASLRHHSARPPADGQAKKGVWSWLTAPSGTVVHANPPASQDTLSDTKALREIERLYRLQARLTQAQAAKDAEGVEATLHTAIDELGSLADRPGLVQRPQFQRAFRTLTSTYESRYGVPDTLHLPDGKIYELQRDLSNTLDQPDASLVDVLPADLRKQELDVPLTINRPVRETMAFLLDNRQTYLYPWLQRASTYFPMIEQILAEEGIPDEIKYLAIAESGLDPHAESRARAAGIWQFVAQTARQYDLSIDPWVDERLDPEKSTRAAARHLKDLYEKFGDWELALAGYNCNPGVVEYQIRKYRQRTGRDPSFWDIYQDLPEETRNYVPLFTATAVIISNPAAFDLERVRTGPRYAFDYVPVEAALPIDRVARLAEVDVQKVRSLNPELQSNRLPPSKEPYYVRLPYGTYSTFSANYDELPDEEHTQKLKHVFQSGETVGRIAQRYHVDRSALLDANDEDRPFSLQAGQQLTLPVTSYNGNARIADRTNGEPIRVRYGARTVRPLVDAPPNAERTGDLSSSLPARP